MVRRIWLLQLADESLQRELLGSLEGAQNYQNGMKGMGLYAALLSKASNQVGELYYRLGVLNTYIEGQSLLTGSATCELVVATEFNVALGIPLPYVIMMKEELPV